MDPQVFNLKVVDPKVRFQKIVDPQFFLDAFRKNVEEQLFLSFFVDPQFFEIALVDPQNALLAELNILSFSAILGGRLQLRSEVLNRLWNSWISCQMHTVLR